jgi:hypothetical protein
MRHAKPQRKHMGDMYTPNWNKEVIPHQLEIPYMDV